MANRIAKIELRPAAAAALLDENGNVLGGMEVLAGSNLRADLLREIAARWPGLPEPAAPAVLPNGLPPVGTRGFLRNDHQDRLKRHQAAAKRAYDLMLETIIGFDPCATMRIGDAQYLARMAQTYVFNALEEEDAAAAMIAERSKR